MRKSINLGKIIVESRFHRKYCLDVLLSKVQRLFIKDDYRESLFKNIVVVQVVIYEKYF